MGLVGAIAFVLATTRSSSSAAWSCHSRGRPEPEPEPVPVAAAPQASSAKLASLLAPLVEALREDLNHNPRTGEHRQNGKPSWSEWRRTDEGQAGRGRPDRAVPGGLWLVAAPFAVGYQPRGAEYLDATVNDLWLGGGIAALSFVALVVYAADALRDLARRGKPADS
ncbi:hypothetical protein [Nonomuraea rubra]|uniref:hypothetical protein n=1 Tax=Nonomuraea rubra TaxID=46180 RepID=UPI0031EB8B4A